MPKENLEKLFQKFPGIGPRQARRFVFFLLRQNPGYINSLINNIANLHNNIRLCEDSAQHFYSPDQNETLSPIAKDPTRDSSTLMILATDTDLEAVEKSGTYKGKYFVLGGLAPMLDTDLERYTRITKLISKVEEKAQNNLKEIIIAFSANREGDHTKNIVLSKLKPIIDSYSLKVTSLGRGLSTGSELEYSDKNTLKSAIDSRIDEN